MIKPGDKVKFSKYIPKNYLSNHFLKKTLSGERIIVRNYTVKWSESRVDYNSPIVNDIEREGIFTGWFRKKLSRSYRRTTVQNYRLVTNPFDETAVATIQPAERQRSSYRLDRMSTDPARIDNPRKLDKLAMIKYKNMLLGVPIANIYKCTFDQTLEIL